MPILPRSTDTYNQILVTALPRSEDHDALMDIPGHPSESYFWRRKRDRSLRLLQRHCEFAAPAARPERRMLLDLGCGNAADMVRFTRALQPFVASGAPSHEWHFIGLDGDGPSLEVAKRRLAGAPFPVEFRRADLIPHVDLPDQIADVIVCSEVIEHLIDPVPFIREWRRLLRPGGRVLVTTPNQPNIFQPSFYSRARRERNRRAVLESPTIVTLADGSEFRYWGHVGIRRIDEWEHIFREERLDLVDFERGALVYGTTWQNHPAVFAVQRLAEGILDLLPGTLTRFISDGLIALYRVRS